MTCWSSLDVIVYMSWCLPRDVVTSSLCHSLVHPICPMILSRSYHKTRVFSRWRLIVSILALSVHLSVVQCHIDYLLNLDGYIVSNNNNNNNNSIGWNGLVRISCLLSDTRFFLLFGVFLPVSRWFFSEVLLPPLSQWRLFCECSFVFSPFSPEVFESS